MLSLAKLIYCSEENLNNFVDYVKPMQYVKLKGCFLVF